MMKRTLAEGAIRAPVEFKSGAGRLHPIGQPDTGTRAVTSLWGSRREMYEEFFQLERNPFGMNPDPNYLFMTPSHREAFAGLLYAMSRRKGFVVLTGDAGTGKTTLLRALITSSEAATFSIILTPRVNADEFLELALMDFGVTEVPATKSQRISKLQNLLAELRAQGKAPVLIVDEAHTLNPETLEEIRLLTNFETSEEKLLQVVLAGQNDLAAILNRQDLRQLKQRIEVRMDLKPLASEDVGAYMLHRWTRAGGAGHLPFTPDAIALIAKASRGIPRLVNCICDNSLLLAYASEDRFIGVRHIRHVLQDFDLADAPRTPSNGLSVHSNGQRLEEHLARARSSIAPRSPLAIEDDGPVTQPSGAIRWAERMNFGAVQPKRDKA